MRRGDAREVLSFSPEPPRTSRHPHTATPLVRPSVRPSTYTRPRHSIALASSPNREDAKIEPPSDHRTIGCSPLHSTPLHSTSSGLVQGRTAGHGRRAAAHRRLSRILLPRRRSGACRGRRVGQPKRCGFVEVPGA